MPRGIPATRARHTSGVNRVEQAQRIRELIGKMPDAERNVPNVRAVLKQHGIPKLGDGPIYGHIGYTRKLEKRAANGNGNGSSVDIMERIAAAEKAIKACGGLDALRETVAAIERMKKIKD